MGLMMVDVLGCVLVVDEGGLPKIHNHKNTEYERKLRLLVNPNAETDDNITPLFSAVAAGSLACIELLIQAGARVNVAAGGVTPLHIAADNGNPEIINYLLKAGADPNVTEDGQKPIQVAAAAGNRAAVKILFPLTSKVQTIPFWTVDGILEYIQSEAAAAQVKTTNLEEVKMPGDSTISKQNLPEVPFSPGMSFIFHQD